MCLVGGATIIECVDLKDHYHGNHGEEVGKKGEEELSEINICPVSGGQNKLVGHFKMVARDLIGVRVRN